MARWRISYPVCPARLICACQMLALQNGGTLLLFLAFYDLSLYIADYVEFFRDLFRAPCAESGVSYVLCTLGEEQCFCVPVVHFGRDKSLTELLRNGVTLNSPVFIRYRNCGVQGPKWGPSRVCYQVSSADLECAHRTWIAEQQFLEFSACLSPLHDTSPDGTKWWPPDIQWSGSLILLKINAKILGNRSFLLKTAAFQPNETPDHNSEWEILPITYFTCIDKPSPCLMAQRF